jgi:hypothetical protein
MGFRALWKDLSGSNDRKYSGYGLMLSEQLVKELGELFQSLYENGELKIKKKCCGKCAFRANSPERCNPYEWLQLADAWLSGKVFICHEGIVGHQHHVPGQPIRVCAGWSSMADQPRKSLYNLAYLDERLPDPKFQ